MRMKGGCRNGAGSILLKKAGIWFDAIKIRTVDVENIDIMTFRASTSAVSA